jgi:predicted ATPase
VGGRPLVGRDDERERLVDALAECRSGTGRLVLVSGEAGVGKSRLVTEALSAWDGCRLSATARPGAGPYAVLTEVLRPDPGRRRGEGKCDDWRDDGELTDALRALVGRGPTVLVLEDLHLADAATLELLPALADALEPEALLLVGVYRSDDLPRAHPIRRLRTDLRRAGHLVDITLRPLTASQTGELLAALLGGSPSPRLVTAVHERTDGLPFFVEELAAALRDGDGLEARSGALDLAYDAVLPLPESVLDAVLARTAQLREQHCVGIESAATLGVQVDLPVLASLAGSAEVDALLEAGLLLEFDDTIAVFRHALVREALYRTIPWARRRSHHRQVAEVLAARGAAPAVIADHWIAAHAPERARPLLLTAAEQHCAVHAYPGTTVDLRVRC